MKTGRNEPCPCGSGKKYKKCCQLKPYHAQLAAEAKAREEKARFDALPLEERQRIRRAEQDKNASVMSLILGIAGALAR